MIAEIIAIGVVFIVCYTWRAIICELEKRFGTLVDEDKDPDFDD